MSPDLYDDEDDLDEDFLDDDDFEDPVGMQAALLKANVPSNWHVVRIDFWKTGQQLEEWLKQNCSSAFTKIGWRSGCSTKVAVAFDSTMDAVLCKLRFG